MRAIIGPRKIRLTVGDITGESVDAIVNAANRRLIPGSGVDGAIHKAAGPAIAKETKQKYPDGCEVGSAVLSHAGFLRCQYVIHAVGPQWRGGDYDERQLLKGAYMKSLEIAAEHSCVSIAFPAISTGAYGYPVEEAAAVALEAIRDFQHPSGLPADIHMVLYDTETLKVFEKAMKKEPAYEIEI